MTLREAVTLLRSCGVDSPEYDAREIFCASEGRSRAEIIGMESVAASAQFEEMIKRRAAREPLQYILGEVGFFRESYKVTPDVLIPRADTEILVEYATAEIPRGARFLDLCTGSGCIAVSTLKNTVDTTALAVDVSEAALAVARENAERNGVSERLTLKRADLLCEVPEGKYFAVLSNPPYVSESDYLGLESEIYHEPRTAFVGGSDGLDFYKRLIPLSIDLIEDGGFAAFEIGFDQGESVSKIAEMLSVDHRILRDYAGNDRVLVIRKKVP